MPKYASVYDRADSRWWWIAYWDPAISKRVCEKTTFLKSELGSRLRALNLAFEKSKVAMASRGSGKGQEWECWVPGFLDDHYPPKTQGASHTRACGAWKYLRMFFAEEDIPGPGALRYAHLRRYVQWRTSQIKPSSGKRVKKNTAVCDLQILSAIMNEARKLGFIETSPCYKSGISKEPAEEKREITGEEIEKIRSELKAEPEWMQVAFEIAIHQGCRLSETAMPWSQVDFVLNTITFAAKGRNGKKHIFTTMLHPGLKPYLEKLKATGRKTTCDMPVMRAKAFHFFFKRIQMADLCFHCTRVTVITRMARAGVPISIAMAYVGHASETVHRIYQKLRPADAAPAIAAITPGLKTAVHGGQPAFMTVESAIAVIQPGTNKEPAINAAQSPEPSTVDALMGLLLSDPAMATRLRAALLQS